MKHVAVFTALFAMCTLGALPIQASAFANTASVLIRDNSGDTILRQQEITPVDTSTKGPKGKRIAADHLTKREVISRPIQNCPGDAPNIQNAYRDRPNPWTVFTDSSCQDTANDNRAYMIRCTQPGGRVYQYDFSRCAQREICVNGAFNRDAGRLMGRAYCVGQQSFVAIAQAYTDGDVKSLELGLAGITSPKTAMTDLVLVGKTDTSVYFQADEITLTGLDANNVAIINSSADCQTCSRLSLQWPPNLGAIRLSVKMPHAGDGAQALAIASAIT